MKHCGSFHGFPSCGAGRGLPASLPPHYDPPCQDLLDLNAITSLLRSNTSTINYGVSKLSHSLQYLLVQVPVEITSTSL